ncbi:M28 family metallopeptidase [Streptomyces erythrochromogenes]|uniref:M28 family metallopeptidase n=1 Tax=Streptomyces erythrochromogenes TaxID=285574 RepID=UPI0036F5FF1E
MAARTSRSARSGSSTETATLLKAAPPASSRQSTALSAFTATKSSPAGLSRTPLHRPGDHLPEPGRPRSTRHQLLSTRTPRSADTGTRTCRRRAASPSRSRALLDFRTGAPPGRLAAVLGDGLPSPRTIAAVRAAVTSEVLSRHVARISGIEPLVEGKPLKVRSRDASAADNARVVEALARRFEDLGLTVRLHPFRWRGHRLLNVEAEHRVPGAESTVLITAHMDSTAANGDFVDADGDPRPYDPAVDPAPGADDDGSGTAAVMAAAECLRGLLDDGREPTRNVRFVLFNAEEQGLVGSKFYARAAAAAGDRIAGVFQMDMIAGRQQGSSPVVEIHAGSLVPGPVVSASDALGERVARTVPVIDSGVTVQQLTGPADPAAGRSDHASFHERGWAAVAVSEDLFSTPDGDPGTGTRQYHTPGDTLLDPDHNPEFAATVARSVIATALAFAGL